MSSPLNLVDGCVTLAKFDSLPSRLLHAVRVAWCLVSSQCSRCGCAQHGVQVVSVCSVARSFPLGTVFASPTHTHTHTPSCTCTHTLLHLRTRTLDPSAATAIFSCPFRFASSLLAPLPTTCEIQLFAVRLCFLSFALLHFCKYTSSQRPNTNHNWSSPIILAPAKNHPLVPSNVGTTRTSQNTLLPTDDITWRPKILKAGFT
jgi:hypothetical protein